jgi:transaldolase
MKLLLESAALDVIRWALDAGLADGVYVTPAALDADAFGIEPAQQVEAIARLSTSSVIVVIGAVAADDLHREGRELARRSDSVVAAVPFVDDGIVALRKLTSEGQRTGATFIVTAAQALLAAKAGAAYVAVAVDHLDAHGHDPVLALREIRALFDRHGVECEVIAVASTSPRLATAALVAGADAVVVTPGTLRALIQHPLTDRALDQLLGEVSRRPRPHPG